MFGTGSRRVKWMERKPCRDISSFSTLHSLDCLLTPWPQALIYLLHVWVFIREIGDNEELILSGFYVHF